MATQRIEELIQQLAAETQALQAENERLQLQLRDAGQLEGKPPEKPTPSHTAVAPPDKLDGDTSPTPVASDDGFGLSGRPGRPIGSLDIAPTDSKRSPRFVRVISGASKASKADSSKVARTETDDDASEIAKQQTVREFEEEVRAENRLLATRSTKADLSEIEGEIRTDSYSRYMVAQVINTRRFDLLMGVVIVANSLVIGLESHTRLLGEPSAAYAWLENIFLGVYILELAARLYAYHLACFQSSWVVFDAVLVGLGLLEAIISIIFASLDLEHLGDPLGPVLALRVFRLFRFARAIRLLAQFRTLWLLVQGLVHSGLTITYAAVLISIILYIFSCVGVEIIAIPWGDEQGEFGKLVRDHWYGIPRSMLTLLRFVTFDSIGGMYEPMIFEHNYLLLFFVPFLLIVSVALMNLVTAVIVEGAMQQSQEYQEAELKAKKEKLDGMIPRMRKLFNELDSDGSGFLSIKEMNLATGSVSREVQGISGVTLEELFSIIDDDDSGEVSIDEFCDGITALTNANMPRDMFVVSRQLRELNQKVGGLLAVEEGIGRQRLAAKAI